MRDYYTKPAGPGYERPVRENHYDEHGRYRGHTEQRGARRTHYDERGRFIGTSRVVP